MTTFISCKLIIGLFSETLVINIKQAFIFSPEFCWSYTNLKLKNQHRDWLIVIILYSINHKTCGLCSPPTKHTHTTTPPFSVNFEKPNLSALRPPALSASLQILSMHHVGCLSLVCQAGMWYWLASWHDCQHPQSELGSPLEAPTVEGELWPPLFVCPMS